MIHVERDCGDYVCLTFQDDPGFQDPLDERLGHWEVMINVCIVVVCFGNFCIVGGLFYEFVRALVAKGTLCTETWPRCILYRTVSSFNLIFNTRGLVVMGT